MRGLATALVFLTRLPLRTGAFGPGELAGSIGWFPVVGALVGVVVGTLAWAGYRVLPSLLAATVAVGVGILLTGAFHEDGLADTLDGMGAGPDRDRALAAMTDSRLGTFGTLGLLVVLLARVAALAGLAAAPLVIAATVAAHAVGRGVALTVMAAMPPARGEGLGAAYLRHLRPATAWTGMAVAAAIGLLLGPAALFILPVALAVGWLPARWARRRLEGVTGDVAGACEQAAETTVLVAAASPLWGQWLGW